MHDLADDQLNVAPRPMLIDGVEVTPLQSGAVLFSDSIHPGETISASLDPKNGEWRAFCSKGCRAGQVSAEFFAKISAAKSNGNAKAAPREEPRQEPKPERRQIAANAHTNGNGHRDLLTRVPPQNLEAEQSVLGAILLENEAIGRIGLGVETFYRETHREIYKAMLTLRGNGKPIDAITLGQQLKTAGAMEAVGGYGYIADLAAVIPEPGNVEHYAAIVREAYIKREVITRTARIQDHAFNGVSAESLIGEMERTLKFDTDVPAEIADLPSLVRTNVETFAFSDLRRRRATRARDWVVEGWLARRETSSISGKVEGGKTTLMRELTLAVIRGEPFLGRPTVKGRVFYAMLDADGEDATYDEFEKLGFNDEDEQSCQFMFEPMLASITKGLEQFVKRLLDFKPTRVIIDPYPRLKLIEDFTSYSNTYLMGMLSEIARMIDAHLALPGHIPRGRSDDDAVATAGFGSISFSGGVNARFVVTDRNGIHTIRTSAGKAAGFQPLDGEYVLTMDENHRISLGQAFSWKDKGKAAMATVAQFLDTHSDRPFDLVTLTRELQMQRSVVRTAVSLLYGGQKIKRAGEGLKGKPYIYAAMGYRGALTMEEVKRE